MPDERVTTAAHGSREIAEALGFEPDNHHNALLCPYCGDQRQKIEREVAERLIAAIRRAGAADVTWLREHKQNHEDLVRIVGTEDGYNAAIRAIRDEVQP